MSHKTIEPSSIKIQKTQYEEINGEVHYNIMLNDSIIGFAYRYEPSDFDDYCFKSSKQTKLWRVILKDNSKNPIESFINKSEIVNFIIKSHSDKSINVSFYKEYDKFNNSSGKYF